MVGRKEGVVERKEGVEGDDAATVAAAAIEAKCSSLPGEGGTINDSRFELRGFFTSCRIGRCDENDCEDGRTMGTGGLSVEVEDSVAVGAKVEAELPIEGEAGVKTGEAKDN